MEEIWRDISDFEGFYQISNLGRIRSLDRIIRHSYRKYFRKGKILSQSINIWGYSQIILCKNGSKCNLRTHRLVAQAFIPNEYLKPQINHINGIKTDNRIENLEWVTFSENQKHAFKIGLKSHKGIKNSRAKLTIEDIEVIKKIYINGKLSLRDIAKNFNISHVSIYRAINNITYQ